MKKANNVTRKKYNAPKLTVYGDITDLTKASDTGAGDGVFPNTLSGTST